jgi:hypothetical protein
MKQPEPQRTPTGTDLKNYWSTKWEAAFGPSARPKVHRRPSTSAAHKKMQKASRKANR